jgi:hypothetical protein
MGAEQQIGQLNMASPDADISDAATPETTNPVTPETRQLSPSASLTPQQDAEYAERVQPVNEPICTRQIDLDLVEDPVNFQAEVDARNASRANKLKAKAETFHGSLPARTHSPSAELAATIDARTGQAVQSTGRADRFTRTISGPVDATGTSSQDSHFIKPPKRYGKLSSMPGSFANVSVNLEARNTMWGRGIDCTVRYANINDARIPKYALKIYFWAPGMDAHVTGGGNWTEVSGVRTLVATSASGCIWINDVPLRKESASGDASLFGKLHTDDVVTIYDKADGFLKFKVEITFGDGARPRPVGEKGFLVEEERHHHQKMKERESMRLSMRDDGAEGPSIPTVQIEAAL